MHKTTPLACLALIALSACSRQKPLSREELESKLRSSASIAAEAGTFLDYVEQKRATNHYAKGHLEYLASEVDQTAEELREAIPPAGVEAQFANCRKEVNALAAVLRELHSHIDQPEDFARERDQIATIRAQLQRTISSL